MKITFKITFIASILLALSLSLSGCDSKEECKKKVVMPQGYFIGNQFYTYDILQEVPCDFPEAEIAKEIEPPKLENFSYEVIFFTFTPDTGENTSRLAFQIILNNPNDYDVNGVPVLTIASQGLEFIGGYTRDAINPCYSIAAASSCVFTFDKLYPIDVNIGTPQDISLVKVEYFLTN